MSRPLVLFVLLAAAWPAVVLATGFGGDSPPTRIPVPSKVYSATVEDRTGTSVEVTRISLNGEVYLYGAMGEAQVTIPFDKIADVRVEPSGEPDDVIAFARMVDGSTVRIVVDHDLPCYGDTTYGHYKIEVDKVRKITFRHEAPPAP